MKLLTHKQLNQKRLTAACLKLSADECLGQIYSAYGAPPLWARPPGFATLLQIILEQQVSLASAKACFNKLALRLDEISPHNLLGLDDAELRTIGFSRQKTAYARNLAVALLEGRLDLDRLQHLPDDDVKAELTRIKGIGEWTSDIYLLMALLRPDVMPKGDIALHSAWHRVSGETRPGPYEFIEIAERWRPHRSTAARLLWHFYLSDRKNTGKGLREANPNSYSSFNVGI